MSRDPVILIRDSEETATCILNRAEKRNALSIDLMRQLCAHIEEIKADRKARILILRGNGPVFSAGLDLDEVLDSELWVESAKMVRDCLSTLYQTSLMTIAMVHGAALGGGAGLVAACNFAIADKNTVIGFPEVHRGLVAAQVMSLLVRKLKRADVNDLLLTGQSVDAERAMQIGLFHRVGNVEVETRKIVNQLLRGAPQALAKTKHLLDRLYHNRLRDDIEMCMALHMQTREGKEAQEGISAFLGKRKPLWEKEGSGS
jgi:enoyl-CoA hydratase/carnithine racemase